VGEKMRRGRELAGGVYVASQQRFILDFPDESCNSLGNICGNSMQIASEYAQF
jgi:hypothetical protein